MPIGLPLASELTSGRVGAFSLDTSIVERAGFRFRDGGLAALRTQLPPWMVLILAQVVAREITDHRTTNLDRALLQIRSGYSDLERHIGGLRFPGIPQEVDALARTAASAFETELREYVSSFKGAILDLDAPSIAQRVSSLYFDRLPPFARSSRADSRDDRKREFPDALALCELEHYASDRGTLMVLASADEQWRAFAEHSERLYCASSLGELAGLFASSSQDAIAIASRLRAEVQGDNVEFWKQAVLLSLRRKLPSFDWQALPVRYWGRILRGTILNATPTTIAFTDEAVRVWLAGSDKGDAVALLTCNVGSTLDLHLHSEPSESSDHPVDLIQTIPHELELQVLLRLRGHLLASKPVQWSVEVDFADVEPVVSLEGFKGLLVPPRARQLGGPYSDAWDDDIPF